MSRSKGLAAVAVSALAAGAAGGWALTRPSSAAEDTPADAGTQPTTSVTKQDLTETKEVDGTLGYGDQAKLVSAAQGTVTWLPAIGSVVTRGQPLARVDQKRVTLLYGTVPTYRTLSDGAEGADVAQLETNLAALGYTGFTADDEYTENTAEAVEEWQEDLGLDETGTVKPDQVVFLPGAIRVAELAADLGGKAASGLLSYTGTLRVVTIALEVADQALAVKGARVSIDLPSGSTKGTVASVGKVAELPPDDGNAQNDASASDATIDVEVTLDDPKAAGALDEAPVTVRLVSEQRKGVLTVPVSALLALKEGGYGVQVDSKVVAVELGMFANGRVEVSGPGIAAGTKVGVPQT